jgi:hypothetical protein
MAPPREPTVGPESSWSAAGLTPIQSGSSDLNPTIENRRYRFGCNFAKETLLFSSLEPAVQNIKSRIRFDLLKAYFVSVNEKYVF